MKTPQYSKSSLQYAENMISLYSLAFVRARDNSDVRAMGVACAKGAYWEREQARRGGATIIQNDRNHFRALDNI